MGGDGACPRRRRPRDVKVVINLLDEENLLRN